MKCKAIFLLLISTLALKAQDAYHQSLLDQLQNDYYITGGTWTLSPDAEAIMTNAWSYGDDPFQVIPASNQTFTTKTSVNITTEYENHWNAGWGIGIENAINENDVCLMVFWARAASGNEGRLSAFVENSITYYKEVYTTFPVGNEWRQYIYAFESGNSYDVDGLQMGFHTGAIQQHVEYAGVNILNYGNSYSLDDLPEIINNDTYGGHEADAPWRAAAETRIENLRKAPLEITVQNAAGNPMPNVGVGIEMLQHEYAFGTAVVSCMFAQNDCQNQIYEDKLLDLDGEGHGFNWVVFENGMKWPAWEGGWPNSQFEKADAVEWLGEKNIQVRGHTLLWPGRWTLPNDVRLNIANTNYVLDRIDGHLEEILEYPSINGALAEWDVVNEITQERFLEDSLAGNNGYVTGREIYAEIFEKTKALDAVPKLYINDYMTISSQRSRGPVYDRYQQFIQEIIDADAPLDGIGFQAHIGTYPTSIYQVETILDDFYAKYNLTHKITEFDIDGTAGDEVEAAYMRDFLTYVFSHPSTDGFLMWGFWDGEHWKDNAPMFDLDWNLKPSGQAFIDLVFKKWWTKTFKITDTNGQVNLSGFKGRYVIQINCDQIIRDTIELTGAGNSLNYPCEELVSIEELESTVIKIFPNPSSSGNSNSILERVSTKPAVLRIINARSQLVLEKKISGKQILLNSPENSGMYFIEIQEVSGITRLPWIVN